MNAKLQQLMDQSFTDHQGEQFDPERFAELIVRECMTNLYLNGYDDAMIQIEKHFGVEE